MFCPSIRVLSLVQLVPPPPPSPLFTPAALLHWLTALHARTDIGQPCSSSCLLLNSLRKIYTTVSEEIVQVHSELYPRVQQQQRLLSGLRRSFCYPVLIRKKQGSQRATGPKLGPPPSMSWGRVQFSLPQLEIIRMRMSLANVLRFFVPNNIYIHI